MQRLTAISGALIISFILVAGLSPVPAAASSELKKEAGAFPGSVTLYPDAPGSYSLQVLDGAFLVLDRIPAGVVVKADPCAGLGTLEAGHRFYPLRQDCILRITVSQPSGTQISLKGHISDQSFGSGADSGQPIEFTLLPLKAGVPWSAILIGALAVFLLLAGGTGWYLLRLRGHSAQIKADSGPQGRPNTLAAEARAGVGATPTSPSAAVLAFPGVARNQPTPLEELQDSVKALESYCKGLGREHEKLRTDVTRELSTYVDHCQKAAESAIRSVAEEILRMANEARAENTRMAGRVRFLETQLSGMEAKGREGLVRLLEVLPRTVLDASESLGNGALARKLEEAVGRYLREQQPPAVTVGEHLARASAVLEAMSRLQTLAAAPIPEEAAARLASIAGDLQLIRDELAAFDQRGGDKRLRLLFAVDFSTHEAARQSLTQTIAAGLEREIVKLDSFDEYYAKRIGMLAAQAAAECADLADAQLDPLHSISSVQTALASVLRACDVEEIAPRRNDPFLATDHTILQIIRCRSTADRNGAVAQLVSRGLRQGGRVVRKATVVLFE